MTMLLKHATGIVMCLNIGTHKIIDFPFRTNGNLIAIGVPIFKHTSIFSTK